LIRTMRATVPTRPLYPSLLRSTLVVALSLVIGGALSAQSLGNAGTIIGMVTDPSGLAVPNAQVALHNAVTNFQQSVQTGADGGFRMNNLPPNAYHLDITSPGFAPYSQSIDIRNAIPVQIKAMLQVASATTSVVVEGGSAEALETDPSSHVDADRNELMKLPTSSPGSGLSQAIIYSTGAVAADGNGSFHPLGDHAEVTFVIDGQPISDQQSKVYSTQLPLSAVQSMEMTTGTPGAEFGDKTSLTAEVTTRSGLGAGRVFGSVDSSYGSFGTVGSTIGLGYGNAKFGNFLAIDGDRSGRFLDTPEISAIHDVGNNETIFDRLDYQPNGSDVFHLNLFMARNWIQIPNDYDQLSQDQKQRVLSWSVAPGYQHTFNAHTLLTINPYIRKDQFNYYPSENRLLDQPATQSQQRQLLNWGTKADIAISSGHHNFKAGIDVKQTRLLENFQFGVTSPAYNSPCVNEEGVAVGNPALTSTGQCAAFGDSPNVASNPLVTGSPFVPGLLPYDLSRGGQLFNFHATANINQAAFYLQDGITLGSWQVNLGLRYDYYDGLVAKSGWQPRTGLAYNIKKTGTVLRVAYARTFETPFNENLLLSSATGIGGAAQSVFGSSGVAIQPGSRNQFNTGFQQSVGKFLLIDADYFWKFTRNAFDFSTLLNSTITFPISWHNSKLDGVTGRVSTTNLHGFQAYWTFGHTRARYFFPENGGLISQGTPLSGSVFRIDHDQVFQSTVSLRYQRPHNGEWVAFTMRFDSGEVVSGVPDAGAALALTPNQQVTLGLACNGGFATVAQPIRDCLGPGGTEGLVTSKLITLPQGGYDGFVSKENDDHNPDRVDPRVLLNVGIGSDNVTHREGNRRFTASLEVENLTNKVALYNFLSTFSGTHFVPPRTLTAHIGMVF